MMNPAWPGRIDSGLADWKFRNAGKRVSCATDSPEIFDHLSGLARLCSAYALTSANDQRTLTERIQREESA
jgi:hypothetical protein